jgi:hypothetical protein
LVALHARLGADFFQDVEALPDWANALLRGAAPSRKVADPEKSAENRAKTRHERLERAANGFEDLDAWLQDTLRRGLATTLAEDRASFEAIATRLADASLTGLSRQLRLAAAHPTHAADWAERSAALIGNLYLCLRAFRQRAALPPALLFDLENQIGIATKKEQALAEGEKLRDRWMVLGSRREVLEGRLSARRCWLLGRQSGRFALLLDFAFAGAEFPPDWPAGSTVEGELAFYPSAYPLRALPSTELRSTANAEQAAAEWLFLPDFETMLGQYAAALAQQPWLAQFPALLLARIGVDAPSGRFFAVDAQGQALPLALEEQQGWALLAQGGGYPIGLFGEWDGRDFLVVSAK